MKKKLAIHGGIPEVDISPPHFIWPEIEQTDIDVVVEQLKSSQISYYRNNGIIKEFEVEFSKIHQCKYAISTCSGSAAIHAAFFSLNLPYGSEVIAPSYTHLATVFPMLHVGLVPVLVDIEEQTGNINPDLIEEKITEDTKAIIVTHQYGVIANMSKIKSIAAKYNLKIIEDCSHAHGASYNGQMAGTFGDIACFSLQSHKTVFGGEGGIILTNDAKLANRASLFGHFREEREYTQPESIDIVGSGYGLKNRLHPLAATLALEQLKKMPSIIEERIKNYSFLINEINSIKGIEPLHNSDLKEQGGFFRFMFKYKSSELGNLPLEKYIEALKAEGVTEIISGSLAKPVHYFKFFQKIENGFYPIFFKDLLEHKKDKLIYEKGAFPIAEYFSENTIQFPPFTKPSKKLLSQYVNALKKVADLHIDLL